jgi:hypothetical protein
MTPVNLHIVSDQKSTHPEPEHPDIEKNVREKRHWDDESIIIAYADWFMENRRIPSHKEIIENGLPPESVIRSYFGAPPINFYQDYFSELYCSEEVLDALEYFYI